MKTAKKSLSILLALAMVFTLFTCLGAATVSAQAAPMAADAAYHLKSVGGNEADVQMGVVNTGLVEGQTYTFSADYNNISSPGFYWCGQWGFASAWSAPQSGSRKNATGIGHIEFSFTAEAPVAVTPVAGGDGSAFDSAIGFKFVEQGSGDFYLWNIQFKDAAGNVLPNTYGFKFAAGAAKNYVYEEMTKADMPFCVDGLHSFKQENVAPATCKDYGYDELICEKCGRVKTEAEANGFTVEDDGLVGIFDFSSVVNPNDNDTYFMCRHKSAWGTQHVRYEFDYYMDAPMIARAGTNGGKDYSGGNFLQGYHHYSGNNDVDPDHGYLQIKVIRRAEWGGNNVTGHIYLWNLKAFNADTGVQFAEFGYNDGAVPNYCAYSNDPDSVLPAYKIPVTSLAHNFVVDTENSTAATCNNAGKTVYKCSACGKTKNVADVAGVSADSTIYHWTYSGGQLTDKVISNVYSNNAWHEVQNGTVINYSFDCYLVSSNGTGLYFNQTTSPDDGATDYNGKIQEIKLGYNHVNHTITTADSYYKFSIKNYDCTEYEIYVWNVEITGYDNQYKYEKLPALGTAESLPAYEEVAPANAANHNFEAQNANATCTTPGETTYVCATCGHVKNVADASAQVSAPLDSDVVYKFHYTKDTPDVGGTSYIPFALGALTVGDTWSLEFDYYTTGPNFSVNNWGADFMLTPSGGGFSFVNGAGHYSATQTVEEGKTNGHEFILQGTTNNADMYIWNVRLTHNGVADNRWETSNRAGSAHPYGPTTVKTNGAALPIIKEESELGDHNYVLTEITAASCTEDGVAKYVCSVCGHVKNIADEAGVPAKGTVYKFTSSEEGKGFLPSKVFYGLTDTDVVTFSFDYYSKQNVSLLAQNYSGAQHTYTKTSQIVAGVNHAEFVATNFNGSFLPNIFEWTTDNLEIYMWNVSLTKNDGDNEFDGFLSGSDHIIESALPIVEATIPASGAHAFGAWEFTAETANSAAFATRSCECGATETVEAKDIIKADWAPAYADAKGGSSQYPGFYLGQIVGLEANDVVTVEFDLYHPGYDPATNILKVRSNNGESATEFNLVEDGVVTTNRTIMGTDGHVVAQYTNTQARDNIYFGLQESVHKGADEIYVWNVKYFVNGEEVTANGDAFSIQRNIPEPSQVLLSRPQPADFQIGTQTNGADTRLIMKLCDDQATIEAYESLAFKVVIDGEESIIALVTVYDGFMDENMGEVTAESLGCNFVAIYNIGVISACNSVTVRAMVNGAEVGVAKTLK